MDRKINAIKELLIIIQNIQISSLITLQDVNELIKNYENKKPISIDYYYKNLIEIKNIKIKCCNCDRTAQFKMDTYVYCWIHSHSLI